MKCAIYMDYDNIWISCYEHYTDTLYGIGFTDKLKDFLKENKYEILKFSAYANFDNGKMMTDKHQTQLQKLGIDTFHCMNGKDSADINIVCDALELLYKPDCKIDTFVFISCDRDITPILRKIKAAGKNTVLITLSVNVDIEVLKQYCDEHYYFEEIVGLEYNEPNKIEFDENIFLEELKLAINKFTNVNYSLFASNMEKKFLVNKGILDFYKQDLIKKNVIEVFEYEFIGKMYYDGIRPVKKSH